MPYDRHGTALERRAYGQSCRAAIRRTDHGGWKPAAGRDPVAVVKQSCTGRLQELIPLKLVRMSASPFAFFRGTAALMAADLAPTATTGLQVQICGDAHVRNLGAFAAPDGHLVFDLNDFDETIPGPWEWDLKRLAASLVMAGGEAGAASAQTTQAVLALTRTYREAMARFAQMKVLDLARVEIRRQSQTPTVRAVLQKAERATPARTLEKLTETTPGGARLFHDTPPVLQHVADEVRDAVLAALGFYRETLGAGRRLILDAYRPCDVAFKVVGTGSVGTRDYIVLMFGNGLDDPMILQVKEALPSCYAPFLPAAEGIAHQGQRVAEGQLRMQTVTDPFLGWTTLADRHFLVRQLADHKASVNPADLKEAALLEYGVVCGEILAKAHARTGDAAAISGYCGDGDKLDVAIAEFAEGYAEQTRHDFIVFSAALKSGRLP